MINYDTIYYAITHVLSYNTYYDITYHMISFHSILTIYYVTSYRAGGATRNSIHVAQRPRPKLYYVVLYHIILYHTIYNV